VAGNQSSTPVQNEQLNAAVLLIVSCAPAKGKTIEKVEFSASVDHHDITIWFTNKTSLNFSIEAGFTLKPEYSDWKSGEQRIVRSWPPLRSS